MTVIPYLKKKWKFFFHEDFYFAAHLALIMQYFI